MLSPTIPVISFKNLKSNETDRFRYVIVLLCSIGICICYADRSNMSVAILPMAEEFGWTHTTQGLILSSFFYGYLLTQVLGGYLSDRFGGKSVLAIASLIWSGITLLTPISAKSSSVFLLIICRIVLGLGEGLSFPAIHSILAQWVPLSERTRSVAIVTASSYVGAILALVISPFFVISSDFGWPWIFYSFGFIGLFWNIPWHFYGSSCPTRKKQLLPKTILKESSETSALNIQKSPRIEGSSIIKPIKLSSPSSSSLSHSISPPPSSQSSAEKYTCNLRVPWKLILTEPSVWAILINQFTNSWGFWVLLTWLPTYYQDQLKQPLPTIGFYLILPYVLQAITGILVGFFGDFLLERYHISLSVIRKTSQCVGMLGTAFSLLIVSELTDSNWILFWITFGQAINTFTLIGVSVSQHDIAPKYAGIIFGLGNTFATIPGIIGVQLTGFILDLSGNNWKSVFYLAAMNYIVGSIVWFFFSKSHVIIH